MDNGPRSGSKTVKRERKFAGDIFAEYGNYNIKRAYRMTEEDFWRLYNLIVPYVPLSKEKKRKR